MRQQLRPLAAAARPHRCFQHRRRLTVLALESSADDSSCAIVTSARRILALATISQHEQNSTFGGIHPLMAQAGHTKNIPRVIEMALEQARGVGVGWEGIDAVAYTRGPGMKGCLHIGEMAAKGLAAGMGKPLVGVHHMQAHALTPLLTEPDPPSFPFLILLVSGGHTQLVLAESLDKYSILLDTLDSKIGDAFEKAARLISLPPTPPAPPAQPSRLTPPSPLFRHSTPTPPRAYREELERAASPSSSSSGSSPVTPPTTPPTQPQRPTEPRPVPSPLPEPHLREFSRLFQLAATSHLTLKLSQTLRNLPPSTRQAVTGLAVSGGVASNLYLREELGKVVKEVWKDGGVGVYYPPIELCTDNAAMIAWAAIKRIEATPGGVADPYDLPLRPKWSLEALYDDVPGATAPTKL
ncbi:hypothetical protein IAT38_003219 [Cryptococcus sp. DSM 104549]